MAVTVNRSANACTIFFLRLSSLSSQATTSQRSPNNFLNNFLRLFRMVVVSHGSTAYHKGHYLTHNIILSHVCASDGNICGTHSPLAVGSSQMSLSPAKKPSNLTSINQQISRHRHERHLLPRVEMENDIQCTVLSILLWCIIFDKIWNLFGYDHYLCVCNFYFFIFLLFNYL